MPTRTYEAELQEAMRQSAEAYEKEQALARLQRQKEELMVQAHRDLVSLRQLALRRLTVTCSSSSPNDPAPESSTNDETTSIAPSNRTAECVVCAAICSRVT